MRKEQLTLEELSARSGIEPRTLRSWVSEGLLSPPLKPGRGARYPARNAYRAIAVRVLKDVHGLSLSAIGRHFLMATEDQIRAWATEAGPTSAPPGSAREYLSRIRMDGPAADTGPTSVDHAARDSDFDTRDQAFGRTGHDAPRLRSDRREDLLRIERLIDHLGKVLKARAPRRSRGTQWTRISVTPDLEISVRGDLEAREQVLFERLADQLRAILTGGTKHD